MASIENIAREKGVSQIRLGASLTAIGFYDKLGYERGEFVDTGTYGSVLYMTKLL
jgi:ribosomal protein S18 acetylase RimI-like enzyme